jgi:hypothetical protein
MNIEKLINKGLKLFSLPSHQKNGTNFPKSLIGPYSSIAEGSSIIAFFNSLWPSLVYMEKILHSSQPTPLHPIARSKDLSTPPLVDPT